MTERSEAFTKPPLHILVQVRAAAFCFPFDLGGYPSQIIISILEGGEGGSSFVGLGLGDTKTLGSPSSFFSMSRVAYYGQPDVLPLSLSECIGHIRLDILTWRALWQMAEAQGPCWYVTV